MGDNKIRSTSDKIVGSPSDRNRKVKSQESGENGSKSWIEKVRQYIGPASAALAMGGLAAQGILVISGVGGSTPEASGTALALRGSDYAMKPPAFPEQRASSLAKVQQSHIFRLRGQNGFLPLRAQRYRKYGLVCMKRW